MTMFLPGGGTITNYRNDYKRYRRIPQGVPQWTPRGTPRGILQGGPSGASPQGPPGEVPRGGPLKRSSTLVHEWRTHLSSGKVIQHPRVSQRSICSGLVGGPEALAW